jgi:pyruvate/2-oxoglutarate/acetoin dehydrogenase E1 component
VLALKKMPTVLELLNSALHRAMTLDHRVVLLGEDILDPYGGAFKVTQGLSTAFADRVYTTPVSEAGIVGVASGMALRGLRPVVEIMFGDFLTLAADQLINHAAKYRWMYNDQVRVPMVVRTPMGGRRGYGPTHSQSLEKHFLGVPGLRVIAPTLFGDPGALLTSAIMDDDDPVLFIEHKLLYPLTTYEETKLNEFYLSTTDITAIKSTPTDPILGIPVPLTPYPSYTLALRDAPKPSLTIVAYGYMAELCHQAQLRLAYDHEIFTELVVPTQLSPINLDPILISAEQTSQVMVVEEGTITMGWGAEVLARLTECLGPNLNNARRLAGIDLPIPASIQLEGMVLPSLDHIISMARSMV